MHTTLTRRTFLSGTAATAVSTCFFPRIIAASKTERPLVIGEGEFRYEVHHHWAQLPDRFTWQTTHNVALDKAGNLYVIHEGKKSMADHPSIFVFDPHGKFTRAFGQQFQGGGHGIEVREEGGEEFLYVCAYQQVKSFAKLTLKGETVWEKYAPMDSGVYAANEDKVRVQRWGRDAFMPTNFAFLNDGGFLLADGYGSFYIHRYDREGNWVSQFGGPGDGKGTFATPHGIWMDRRDPREERVVVCDRAHHTLQFLTLEGKHIETLEGFGLPANIDTLNDMMLVPELHARVTILGKDNKVLARLGADVDRVTKEVKNVRGSSDLWLEGKFVHPHDACFAPNGDIYVAEWVATGRVSKLVKVS